MDWNMDVFHFNTLSCGNPLVAASYIVFKKRKFFSEFQITPQVFINYMGAIQVHSALQVVASKSSLLTIDYGTCISTALIVNQERLLLVFLYIYIHAHN